MFFFDLCSGWTSGPSGINAPIIVSELLPGTEYTFRVKANYTLGKGNVQYYSPASIGFTTLTVKQEEDLRKKQVRASKVFFNLFVQMCA